MAGDTLQLKGYSKTDWPWYFDADHKYQRHETVFSKTRGRAFEMGKALV